MFNRSGEGSNVKACRCVGVAGLVTAPCTKPDTGKFRFLSGQRCYCTNTIFQGYLRVSAALCQMPFKLIREFGHCAVEAVRQ